MVPFGKRSGAKGAMQAVMNSDSELTINGKGNIRSRKKQLIFYLTNSETIDKLRCQLIQIPALNVRTTIRQRIKKTRIKLNCVYTWK